MNSATAQQFVIFGIGLAAGISALAEIAHGNIPRLRILFGAVIAGVVLSIIAQFFPEIAGGFAVLILVGTAVAAPGGGQSPLTFVANSLSKLTGG